MSRLILLSAILIFFINTGVGQPIKHVVLISIDGFRPEFYLDKSWPAPNLQLLMQHGVYAHHMKSVFPSYTYPSHTAMLTGALPARSGIFFNQPKTSRGEWNWFTSAIKVPTLWQQLKRNNMATAAIEWPVSVDSTITYNIPEIWNNAHPEDRITETRKYSTPGLIEEVEHYATGKLDSTNMNEEYFSLDENAGRTAGYILKTKRPSLLAVHFACVDGMQHGYGRDADSVRLAVAVVDRAIGEIIEAMVQAGLEDSTAVLIVGDHGFSNVQGVFRPNMLLTGMPGRFITSGGSAFLYSSSKNPIEISSLVSSLAKKIDSLPSEMKKLFRIVQREELNRMGADSAAILALAAVPGTVFTASVVATKPVNNGPGTTIQQGPSNQLFYPSSGGHHGYDPNLPEMYTGFIAFGAGIEKGKSIDSLTVTDIAPLIAKLLGVVFSTPDGKIIPGITVQ